MKADIKGLEKLAAHLRSVPRKQFDMDQWHIETSCGTAGCIAGHAALVFPSRLKLVKGTHKWGNVRYVTHKRTDRDGEFAFADAFKISDDEASNLCYDLNVHTPKQAARVVDKLVARLKVGK